MSERYPFALLLAFLISGALLRGQAIYWLGRLASTKGSRLPSWVAKPSVTQAKTWLDRFGWPLISFAYLTIGLQSAILAAAGVVQMQWWRFTLAQIPGSIAWGFIYATVGFAAWKAMWLAAAGSWPAWVALGVVGAGLIGWRLGRRR